MPLKSQLREDIYLKFTYYRQLHFSREKIISELLKAGMNEEELARVQALFVSERKRQRHRLGLALTIIGSAILVVGFILTAALYHTNSPLQAVMYGGTSGGLVLLIAGLIMLF